MKLADQGGFDAGANFGRERAGIEHMPDGIDDGLFRVGEEENAALESPGEVGAEGFGPDGVGCGSYFVHRERIRTVGRCDGRFRHADRVLRILAGE
jgi:hypothetical protein